MSNSFGPLNGKKAPKTIGELKAQQKGTSDPSVNRGVSRWFDRFSDSKPRKEVSQFSHSSDKYTGVKTLDPKTRLEQGVANLKDTPRPEDKQYVNYLTGIIQYLQLKKG